MPRCGQDLVVAFVWRKRDEEKNKSSTPDSPPSATNVEAPKVCLEIPEPIVVLHPAKFPTAKRLRFKKLGPPVVHPVGVPLQASPFVALDNFKVTSPTIAFMVRNAVIVLTNALTSYSSSVGGKVFEEKEVLKAEISKMKKSSGDLKKSAKDADKAARETEEAKKKAEDDVVAPEDEEEK